MNVPSSFRRIHPLVAVAAVALTLFSLLGIAAITGVLPMSRGSVADQHGEAIAPAEATAAMAKPTTALAPETPAAKHPHHDVQQVATTSAPANTTSPAPAPAPAKPAAKNSAVGIGVGAVVGGVLGNQVGSGDGKTLATILGAIGGGYVGNEIAKKNQ